MKLEDFFRSKIRLEILNYLRNYDSVFVYQLVNELNHPWGSIYKTIKILFELDLIKISKEEKSKGKGKRRKSFSLTEKGKGFLKLLDERASIKNSLKKNLNKIEKNLKI